MKKNKILIISLIVILIICCVVLGIMISFDNGIDNQVNETNNIVLICDKDTIKIDEEVMCTLKGNATEYQVSVVSSTIEESLDFQLIEVIPHSSWEGDGEFGDVDLYTDVNKSNEFDIFTFNIKLVNNSTDNISISIVNNSFFDENYEEHSLNNITKILTVEK